MITLSASCQALSNGLIHIWKYRRLYSLYVDFYYFFCWELLKQNGMKAFIRNTLIVTAFLLLGGVIAVQVGVLDTGSDPSDGLSGMVAVKGSVSAQQLGLSEAEVKRINRAVGSHKKMFSQVSVFLDAREDKDPSDSKTILVMAMVLETDGNCEVRSWSRKVSRDKLISQMEVYMKKAAREYEEFQKFPDVQQNFKCLYI